MSNLIKPIGTIIVLLAIFLFSIPAQAKYSGGTGEPNDPYQIATAADLIALGETPEDYDKHFILTRDIDLDPNLPDGRVFDKAVIAPDANVVEDYFQGTPFTGVFNGDGYTISHLTVEGGESLGLFGVLDYGAEVRDLAIMEINVNGSSGVGALAGSNQGNVTCCYSTGAVRGSDDVGGLLGFNYGTVTKCYSTGAVSGNGAVGGLVGANYDNVTQCYSTGAVDGNDDVGGLVGFTGDVSIITDCYSTVGVSGSSSVGGLVGRVFYGSVILCYSTGGVSGSSAVGGLMGYNLNGSVTSSFWDTQTSGQSVSAGGTGKTTAQMQMASTFIGWWYGSIWTIDEGKDYPHLYWEGMPGQPISNPYAGGSGRPADPYLIQTADQLNAIGLAVSDWDKHFKLIADIDLDPKLLGGKVFDKAFIAPDMDPNDTWGEFQGTPFIGVFDGNSHTISNLTIRGVGHLGLFGQLGRWDAPGGEVRNLGVVDVNVSGSGSVGGLVGGNEGCVTDCYSSGTVTGGGFAGGLVGNNYQFANISNSYSTCAVTGDDFVGGLIGDNGGDVAHCYSTGTVSGKGCVGGLVGGNNEFGAVSCCYSSAAVTGKDLVGGLVGLNGSYTYVTQCYSTGKVIGDDDVGGLLGRTMWWVFNCFWDTQTSGQATSAGGTGKTTAEMQDPKTFIAAGWDFVNQPDGPHDIWAEPDGIGYPVLFWQIPAGFGLPDFSGGTGEPNNPYLLSNEEDLNSIGHNPRLMRCHFRVAADLDIAGFPYHQIGDDEYPYDGTFDGNGKTIRKLSDTLFRCVTGLIKDLRLVDPNCISSPVRSNYGTISGCSVQGGSVSGGGLVAYNKGTIISCYTACAVTGTDGVGGLVAYNGGTVIQCYSTGKVSGTGKVGGLVGHNWGGDVTQCYSTSAVSGNSSVGGLVGYNSADVIYCYGTGSVSGNWGVGGLVGYNWYGNVSHCYSTGAVTGWNVGGLVGSNRWLSGQDDPVTQCFWDTQTSGQAASAGGTGKTTAEMQMQSTFTDAGWDFVGETANGMDDIWWILEGKDYPRLWWEAHN